MRPGSAPSMRFWGALALAFLMVAFLLLAAFSGVSALAIWGRQVQTPDGAICGSAWHFRPGHGDLQGGQQAPWEIAQKVAACRQAARPTFDEGLPDAKRSALAFLATIAAALGLVLTLSRRTRHAAREPAAPT